MIDASRIAEHRSVMAPKDNIGLNGAAAVIEDSAADRASVARARLVAMGLMILASVGISFGGLISRFIEQADAWQINIHRSLSITAVVAVFLLIRHGTGVPSRFRRIGRPGLIGAVFLMIAGVAFLQAITTTTVANTLFTLSAIPFITAALAWAFLRERLTRITLIAMVFAAGGVGVMIADGIDGGSLYGNLMALVTAAGFSAYAVIVRRYRDVDMQPVLVVSGLMLAAVAIIAAGGDWRVSWHDFWLCFLWGGVLSGVGNMLFIVAARQLMAAELTLFMLLEFALGPLWVWMVIAEAPSELTLVGGTLVMASVLWRTMHEIRVSRRPASKGRLLGPR